MIYTQEEHKASEYEGQVEDLMNMRSDFGAFWSDGNGVRKPGFS